MTSNVRRQLNRSMQHGLMHWFTEASLRELMFLVVVCQNLARSVFRLV